MLNCSIAVQSSVSPSFCWRSGLLEAVQTTPTSFQNKMKVGFLTGVATWLSCFLLGMQSAKFYVDVVNMNLYARQHTRQNPLLHGRRLGGREREGCVLRRGDSIFKRVMTSVAAIFASVSHLHGSKWLDDDHCAGCHGCIRFSSSTFFNK